MPKQLSKLLYLLIPLALIYAYLYYQSNAPIPIPPPNITSFEECAAAGYPVMESYPERCTVPGGETYTRTITDGSPPTPDSTSITISGTYTCLPKRDTGGPVTLECAFGLQTDSGYYVLLTPDNNSSNYPQLYGNEAITVQGSLVSLDSISGSPFQTYDVVGVIRVDTITKL